MSTEVQQVSDVDQVSQALVEFDKVAAGLAILQKNYAGVLFDVETPKGMVHAKAARAAIRKPRIEIEHVRTAAKAPLLAIGRKLDAEAKRITAELSKLEDPIDAQIKEEEGRKEREELARIEANQKRVDGIKVRIAEIRDLAETCTRFDAKAEMIAKQIDRVVAIAVDETFAEFQQEATDTKTATLARIYGAHANALARELEQKQAAEAQAELARLRAENEAREAAERAVREQREREERQKREAEEAAERARLAAEQAERTRLQKIEQDRIDAETARLAAERLAFERQQEEARRAAAETERQRQAAEAAEARRKEEAEMLARKSKYPGEQAIVDVLTKHFSITDSVARSWLVELRKAA